MSHNWIATRIFSTKLTDLTAKEFMLLRREKSYSRHVLFFSVPHVISHAQALLLKAAGKSVSADIHNTHSITHEWRDSDIASVVDGKGGLTGNSRKR